VAVSRRGFLGGAVGLGAGATLGAALPRSALSVAGASVGDDGRIPFEGPHQAGITNHAPSNALIAAFDVVATDAKEVQGTLRDLTEAARWLTTGGPAPKRDPLLPPSDNLILGPDPEPTSLTVTVGVGASLFDDRFGLAARKPKQLRPMEHFNHDQIDPARTHGDLLLQLCASEPDACVHALRILMRATRSTLVLRWMLPGFQRPNTLDHGRTNTRNLLGFKDGTANPDASDDGLMNDLVWVPGSVPGEPEWTKDGSYMVVRTIRTKVEFWDRTALATQEDIIGRHKASGAPLGQKREADIPDYKADPKGNVIPLDAHIRLANPRTPEAEATRILRRGYNFSNGFSKNGQLEQGLLFVCFQRDLDKGFVAVQNRLVGEPLEEYIQPVGGGFFFALPGVRDKQDYLGSGLFA
jgi:deferrochelatase/peroxidase EfeB